MNLDDERLTNLSIEELEALANIILVLETQDELDELLTKNANNQLSLEEKKTLDSLLKQIDHLNIVKARAKYTLSCLQQVK